MRSAFGVEHPGVIFKADDARSKFYRQSANTFGALGATSGALAAGSRTVAHLEGKGKDPMGFTMKEHWAEKAKSPAHKKAILRINRAAHMKQAKVGGGIAATSLAVGGAYKLKQKAAERSISKGERIRRATDAAAGTAALGTGTAAVAGGGLMTGMLGQAAYAHGSNARMHHLNLKEAKQGKVKLGVKHAKWAKESLKTSRKVAGVKGAGAAAGLGVVGLGLAGIHHGGESLRKNPS